jgi:hypothetical protein
MQPACFGTSLGSNPDISQKNKIEMGNISKGVANTLWPAKKYKKIYLPLSGVGILLHE